MERDLLTWVLPENRPPYRPYRACIMGWEVASRGRRGDGHLVLTPQGRFPDLDMPLPGVFAYGVVETSQGGIAVTVRERVVEQLDCDLSNLAGGALPDELQETRRWSFSEWSPGSPCPICGAAVRELQLVTDVGMAGVLAVCADDKRIWSFDAARSLVLPVPLTSFYAELMRVQGIREPKVALNPGGFFSSLDDNTDEALAEAFIHYNKIKPKIATEGIRGVAPKREPLILHWLRALKRIPSSWSGKS